MEGVKNSTLALMNILVTMKEDLAALRKDTQDVMGELATVREDTKSMSQNTESALREIATDLAMLKQDTNSTLMVDPQVSVQYLPTSCDEISQMNPNSPLGFYWIHSETDYYGVQVLCSSPQTPAPSCEHISTHYRYTPSGYYWVESSNGSAVNVYCDSHLTSQDDPSHSCQDIVKTHPSIPSGYYWVEDSNGSAVNVYCYNHMTSQEDPSRSCQYIAETNSSAPSGYYWVESSNGSTVNVYCDMARHCCNSTGGWMRVAYLNMTDSSQQCPEGFTLRSEPNRTCELIANHGCTSILYHSHDIQYSKVCGRARAYQYYETIAFYRYDRGHGTTIDSNYVSGMSITHGESPRKHIWTFAAALDETRSDLFVCPCTKTDSPYTGRVPPFIGNDYFCDTGSRGSNQNRYYWEDPLWDGEGCGPTNSCCQFNSPPWFCKELPQPTTDDVEVRVCTWNQSYRDTPFDFIELYIQ